MKKFMLDKTPLLPLTGPPKLGESYHVSWAGKGVIGICTKIYAASKQVELRRPKQKTQFANLVYWGQLRHTRARQERIEKGLSPYPDRQCDLRHQKRIKKFKLEYIT